MLSVFRKLEPEKSEVLMLVQLSNRCEFILVRSVFILRDTGKPVHEKAGSQRDLELFFGC